MKRRDFFRRTVGVVVAAPFVVRAVSAEVLPSTSLREVPDDNWMLDVKPAYSILLLSDFELALYAQSLKGEAVPWRFHIHNWMEPSGRIFCENIGKSPVQIHTLEVISRRWGLNYSHNFNPSYVLSPGDSLAVPIRFQDVGI